MKLIIIFFCFITIYFTNIGVRAETNVLNKPILKIGLIVPLSGEFKNIGMFQVASLRTIFMDSRNFGGAEQDDGAFWAETVVWGGDRHFGLERWDGRRGGENERSECSGAECPGCGVSTERNGAKRSGAEWSGVERWMEGVQ